jgi:hypothetical protein
MSTPGELYRIEPATGLLIRGIRVNGHYMIVDSCDVAPQQDVDVKHYIQGGPGAAVADIGKRRIDGRITCPIRVNRDGEIDPAVIDILKCAQQPIADNVLTLETNYVLIKMPLVVDEYGGTDGNQLLTMSCVVKNASITIQGESEVSLSVSLVGLIEDYEQPSLIGPPPQYTLGRALSWHDCNASRLQSSMPLVSSYKVEITNELEELVFLGSNYERTDQINGYSWTGAKWSGEYEEYLRKGLDTETFVHGGWMLGENIKMEFGPIHALFKDPVFKTTKQNMTPSILKRSSSFYALVRPNIHEGEGKFIAFSEL